MQSLIKQSSHHVRGMFFFRTSGGHSSEHLFSSKWQFIQNMHTKTLLGCLD